MPEGRGTGRGRGRPRKNPEKIKEEPEIKRGRGRPRKYPVEETKAEHSPQKGVGAGVEERERESSPPLVLTCPPPDSQIDRWHLRGMWELASVLHFLHAFRPVLNINLEFSAEELETALLTPNNTLDQLHIQLLKGIPPVSRTGLGRDTWVTVLCKKLADWWPWVAEGELPLVACHGKEVADYKELHPGTRVLVLKALCEIRAEQEDIWKYIDDALKHGTDLSTFRKVRIGGDPYGTSYWYEGDSTIGHRLYREIQKIEGKQKPKGKGRSSPPVVTCQWETIATSLDEFQAVSEKLASSRNKVEAGIGKKVKNDIVPVLEELQKKKERVLKKQQRQAMLLDSFLSAQILATGRSRRDRKPVKYTFDDYDRSIDEAIQLTKKSRPSPEDVLRRDVTRGENPAANGKENGHANSIDDAPWPESKHGSEESDAVRTSVPLTRSTRLRPRTQRYPDKNYVEAVSDNEPDNEDEIFVEAVYDDGDEEYRGDEEDVEDDDDDEEVSINSEDNDSQSQRRRSSRKRRRGQSVDEVQSGLRRSMRATRNNVDYSKYEMSNSEEENSQDFEKQLGPNGKKKKSKKESDVSTSIDCDVESEGSLDEVSDQARDQEEIHEDVNTEEAQSHEASAEEMVISSCEPLAEQSLGIRNRHFIDLNEASPFTGFEGSPSNSMRNQVGPEESRYEQVQNSENDDL